MKKLTIEDLIAKNIVVLDDKETSIPDQFQQNGFVNYYINPDYQLLIQVPNSNDRFIPLCIQVVMSDKTPKYLFALHGDTHDESFDMYTVFNIDVFKKTTVF